MNRFEYNLEEEEPVFQKIRQRNHLSRSKYSPYSKDTTKSQRELGRVENFESRQQALIAEIVHKFRSSQSITNIMNPHIPRSVMQRQWETYRQGLDQPEFRKYAHANTFRELVYHWAQSTNQFQDTLLSRDYTNRISKRINLLDAQNNIHPSGILLNKNSAIPTITGLTYSTLKPEFTSQEKNVLQDYTFMNANRGNLIDFQTPIIDPFQEAPDIRMVRIGNPNIHLFIPDGVSYKSRIPNTQVHNTPFTRSFVGELADTTMDDLLLPPKATHA